MINDSWDQLPSLDMESTLHQLLLYTPDSSTNSIVALS